MSSDPNGIRTRRSPSVAIFHRGINLDLDRKLPSRVFSPLSQDKAGQKYRRNCNQLHMQGNLLDRPYSLYSSHSQSILAIEEGRVTDGIISPKGELYENGLRPGKALTRR